MCGKGWSGCDALCNVVVGGAAIFRGFVYTGAAAGENSQSSAFARRK
jgi:hypothetical protein